MQPIHFVWKDNLTARLVLLLFCLPTQPEQYLSTPIVYLCMLGDYGQYCISPRLLTLSADCQYYFLFTQVEGFDWSHHRHHRPYLAARTGW